ncbi:hypothetical protein PHMEG_00015797 [Phytophthora megakarya]|uniref:Uncharacterized protein n=1 Tax=Phytophthora megakarya TaxID=4795 RepID=A0A225W0U0_9STRA|nr:hypothetical protein PHMEG_00015797 [Phytophthora megakarya]
MMITKHQWKSVLVVLLVLLVCAEAGYVDLFKNAYFKNKLVTVKDVIVDVCYTFECDYGNSLDDMITSAKWHGLPAKADFFDGGDATIHFYPDQNCKSRHDKSWLIKTQSTKKLCFPENFALDKLAEAISSFKVVNAGGVAGILQVEMSSTATEAEYVDHYRHADFKHKLLRIQIIVYDTCDRITWEDLSNAITSA